MPPSCVRKAYAKHDAAAQPAVPADRCAREIIGFLAVCVLRLRRLNGNPLGGASKPRGTRIADVNNV